MTELALRNKLMFMLGGGRGRWGDCQKYIMMQCFHRYVKGANIEHVWLKQKAPVVKSHATLSG